MTSSDFLFFRLEIVAKKYASGEHNRLYQSQELTQSFFETTNRCTCVPAEPGSSMTIHVLTLLPARLTLPVQTPAPTSSTNSVTIVAENPRRTAELDAFRAR